MRKDLTAWEKTRKFFNDIHLWLGLGSGIIVFLVCLSGTIYTFNTEIREAATPALFNVQAPAGAKALQAEQLIAQLESSTGGKVINVKVPADANRSWQLGVRKVDREAKPGPPAKGGGRPTIYYVNPYTGEVLGNTGEIKNGTVTFMTYMFSLHRWLLLDKIEEPIFEGLENRKLGSYISGTATILFTLGVITGMIIWLPKKVRGWRQGLTIRWSANWKRVNHDLHNTLGLYACIFLFLMGITGPQWSFEWYRTGLRKALGTHEEKAEGPGREKGGKGKEKKEVEFTEERQKASFAAYQETVEKVFTFKGDYVVSLPADPGAPVSVSKFKAGFFAPAAADRLTLDQYSNKVMKVELFADMPFNERTSASIKALHVGDVYGMFTKILYFLSCLVATSLPITGTLIWLNKMKTKKPASRKPVTPAKERVAV